MLIAPFQESLNGANPNVEHIVSKIKTNFDFENLIKRMLLIKLRILSIIIIFPTGTGINLQSCFELRKKLMNKQRFKSEAKSNIRRCKKIFRASALKRLHHLKKTKKKFVLRNWEKYFF